ncbi:hypothetical protein [Alteromonas macleodii]|uniref:RipA family octameric membrane protein n=1 Tax=Alteromonas macleodii TaxID=28108 RepID=UPI0022B01823|nr:hypothetical protein [Alteromonas macleodii]MCZ4240467.1 hypothetical protein [Alteromonas macleodii]
MNEIKQALWQEKSANGVEQNENLIEQYKTYVEMADRISQRRGTANTFFLTFNTAIVGALAGFYKGVPSEIAAAFYAAAGIMAITWALLLRSYRNLNTAKFQVIGELEKRLPAQMFYAAEWKALGEGKDYRKYVPLTVVETTVPVMYLCIYVYLYCQTSGTN